MAVTELGSITLTLGVDENGRLVTGSEMQGNLDYATIRMLLAMASETENVRRLAGEEPS